MRQCSEVKSVFAGKYWEGNLWCACLGGILLLALFLRWPWPEPLWIHVDEKRFIHLPLGFWSGDLNPHFFNYPTLQFYLVSLVYYVYYLLGSEPLMSFVAYRYFVDATDLIAIARGLGTLMSVGTVAVVAFIGRRLYGAAGGLLAAAFAALMPLSVRFAHLAITDTPAVLWTALALLGAVRIVQEGRRCDYLLAGVGAGLAAATKYPAGLVVLPVILAALLRCPAWKQSGLWCAVAATGLSFCATTPYVLLDFQAFWADFSAMGQEHLLAADWRVDPTWWHVLRYNLRYGLGLGGLAALVAALGWIARQRRREELVLAAYVLACYALVGSAASNFMRYALPLVPAMAVLAVKPLVQPVFRASVLAALVVALLAEPAYYAWKTRDLMSGGDTREQARAWIERQAPGGAFLVHLPEGVGNVSLLYPKYVYTSERYFRASYGKEDVEEAYARLANRTELPPLYHSLSAEDLSYLLAAPTEVEEAKNSALILHYRHPVCDVWPIPAIGWDGIGRSAWLEEFSPGAATEAVFDPLDWYFLPIGRFGQVVQTGPAISLGAVPLKQSRRLPSSREFFTLLRGLSQGERAVDEEQWEKGMVIYEEVQRRVDSIHPILTPDRLYMLYGGLATVHEAQASFAPALKYWKKAAHLWPQKAWAYHKMGVALLELGEAQKAIQAWERAVELQPGFLMPLGNLAILYWQEGDLAKAKSYAEKVLELEPDSEEGEQMRLLLQEL